MLFHRGNNYLLYRATCPKVSCCVAFKEKQCLIISKNSSLGLWKTVDLI